MSAAPSPRAWKDPRAPDPKYSRAGAVLRQPNLQCCSSIQPELAVDGPQVGGSEQGLVGDPHAIERALQLSGPERQELVELGKARGEVILLPDELLQNRAVIGHAVENAGRGQAIALQLTSEVTRHHRASPSVLRQARRKPFRNDAGRLPRVPSWPL